MSYLDEQDKRIAEILGSERPLKIDDRTLAKYPVYLKENLELPIHLAGIEDFEGEEDCAIGPGSKKEYERLKKIRPSYLDTFELISFDDQVRGLLFFKSARVTIRFKKVWALSKKHTFIRCFFVNSSLASGVRSSLLSEKTKRGCFLPDL